MEVIKPHTVTITKEFAAEELLNGVHLVIIHATRIPPHIGIIAGGLYHSLTIKGQEVNIPAEALIRNTIQRRIPSLFIKIQQHPDFNAEQLKEQIVSDVRRFPKVAVNGATCLSPVKLFFEVAYGVPVNDVMYIFELLPALEAQGLIEHASALFISSSELQLPLYTMSELNSGIDHANRDAAAVVQSIKMQ